MADEASPPEAKRQKLEITDTTDKDATCDASENTTDNTCQLVPDSTNITQVPDPDKVIQRNDVLQTGTSVGEGTQSDIKTGNGVTCHHTQESDVGITEYISKHEGFQGVIKQRYSDFLVNEISLDGEIVRFTNTDLPIPDDVGTDGKVGKDVSGTLAADKIQELIELLKSKDRSKSVLIAVGDDKLERTNIHQAVSEGFPGLDSCTITKDIQKYIEVKLTSNQGNNLRQWPKARGDYCRFVLYKENKDTMDAVGLIAKQIGLKASLFQYAGTKDRRAKTSQEITVYRVSAEKLKKNNKRLRNIVAGNFRYVKEPLKLGQLLGNRFTVVLRSVTGTTEQIEEAVTSLRNIGFINYYGMQRFGTMSVPTHHVGRAILQGKWKEAIELILKPRDGEDKEMSQARTFWWETRDSKAALAKFPKRCFIERGVLQGLVDNGDNNFLAALNKIPRNTRLMYVHSYQSYIWNKVVSHRVKEFGLSPVLGDLVIPRDVHTNTCDIDDETVIEEKSQKPNPVCVDESNISSYTMEDVVLPLPGYDVIYPDHLKDLYKDLMSADSLDYESMRHKVKDYSLSGDYRHVLVKPKDVSSQEFQYNDVSVPLALSDQDIIDNLPEPKTIKDGAQKALRLEITLPTSCYATMAIREILKTDTSPAYQTTLNVT